MNNEKSSRRNLFSPHNLGKIIRSATGDELFHAFDQRVEEGWLYRLRWKAMGTHFEILIDALDADSIPAFQTNLPFLNELEDIMTVYRKNSELSQVNLHAAQHPVVVSPLLFDILNEASVYWQETGGAFDVAIHPLLKAWGLFDGQPNHLSREEVVKVCSISGFDKVRLDENSRTVFFNKSGVELNLGAIGKGYALDLMSQKINQLGVSNYLLNGGRSSLKACGKPSWDDTWVVRIVDPVDWGHAILHLHLKQKALSTSALDKETILGGKPPHTLDPRSGFPVQSDVQSVTVVADKASRAEALSTAFLVLGLDKTLEYCKKHPDIGVVLMTSGTDQRMNLIVHGIPEECLERLS